jgi:peptidoglycan hydrolase CwlO-like protein
MKTKKIRAKAKPHSKSRVEQAERELRAAKSAAKQAKLDLKGARKAAKQARKRFKAAKRELKVLLKELRQSENNSGGQKALHSKAKNRPHRKTETPVPAALMPRKSRPKVAAAKTANPPARRLPLENPSQQDASISASTAIDPVDITIPGISQERGVPPPASGA